MDNHVKERPTGITIISILVWLYALAYLIMGLYIITAAPKDLTNNLFLQLLNLNLIILNGHGTIGAYIIVAGMILGIIGLFLFQGKRWAKIILGVILGFSILRSTKGIISPNAGDIISFIIFLGIFIYLFFFKSAKEFFQTAKNKIY